VKSGRGSSAEDEEPPVKLGDGFVRSQRS
jgi:hypothetical protein